MPNLVDDIPDDAFNEWEGGPPAYTTEDASGYSSRSGDVSAAIEDASSNGNVAYAPVGEYEIESRVNTDGGDVVGIEGDGIGQTVLYYNDTSLQYWLNLITSAQIIVRDVTIDITEDTGVGDGIPDIGLANCWTSGGGWAENVELRGPRKRWQSINGDMQRVGGNHTWHIDVTSSSATMFQENIDLSDGAIYEPDAEDSRGDHFGQGVGFSLEAGDREHVGLSVFKDCEIRDWANSGFYVYNPAPGRAVLWNCTAANTSASGVRLGRTDEMIGGYLEEHTPQGDFAGYALRVEGGSGIVARGVSIHTSDDLTRSIAVIGNTEEILLDRLAIEHSGEIYVLQLTGSDAQVELRECDIYDTYSGDSRVATFCGQADVDSPTGWNQRSEHNMTDVYNQSGGSLRIEGNTISSGPYSASALGLGDPLPLPDYYFDYTGTGERAYDRHFKVFDSTTGDPVEGVDIYHYRQ